MEFYKAFISALLHDAILGEYVFDFAVVFMGVGERSLSQSGRVLDFLFSSSARNLSKEGGEATSNPHYFFRSTDVIQAVSSFYADGDLWYIISSQEIIYKEMQHN